MAIYTHMIQEMPIRNAVLRQYFKSKGKNVKFANFVREFLVNFSTIFNTSLVVFFFFFFFSSSSTLQLSILDFLPGNPSLVIGTCILMQ